MDKLKEKDGLTKEIPERVESPYAIKDIFGLESPFGLEDCELNEVEINLVKQVIEPLSLCSVAGAIHILDLAKKVIPGCTQLHSKYI